MASEVRSGKRWSWGSFVDSLCPAVYVGLMLPDGTLVHANRAALEVIGARADLVGTPFQRTPWYVRARGAQARLDEALACGMRGQPSRFDLPIETPDGRVIVLDFALRPVLDDDGRVAFLVPSACDATERREAERRASYASDHDMLTGAHNRRWLRRHLTEQLRHAREDRPLTILCIDIDRLARINASLGHAAGDAVLKAAAGRFASCLGDGDVLARVDGDEFMIVLGAASPRGASVSPVALRLLDGLSEPIVADGHEVFVTASIGVASARASDTDLDALLRRAATALEHAKGKGRNNFVVHVQERGGRDAERFELETALRQAVARGELQLVYQPQVDIASGAIVGVEALLRWQHPVFGAVEPERFIPIAEEAGLIGRIGDWVWRTACATASRWQREGLPPVRMMVNVSAYQVHQGGLAARIEAVLAETGLQPARFGIELTESVLMQELDEAARELAGLRDLGVKIALDDFGTGYSSLSYLRRLPLDVVKIDRSLVPAVTGDSDALPIARAIIAMAHSLGLKVVAEGVENESQLELLAAHQCDQFQGFHFSEPVPAEKVEAMLRSGRRLPVLERRRTAQACAVLAVDDERALVERLKQELQWRFGDAVRVETCTDPEAAVRRLREGPPVDVVISDLRMPDVDGIALMNRACELQPQAVRMMLLGAADLVRVIEDRRQVDVFRYVAKPWRREQLFEHFQSALDKVARVRADRALGTPLSAAELGGVGLELLHLETEEPGITAVKRGPLDEVLLPSQLMTLPGDLWTGDPATTVERRR